MPPIIKQSSELWSRLKFGQRLTVVLAGAGTIALMAVLIFYGSQPEYAVLFSDLKPADAQSIVDKLKSQNVPYKLSSSGTVVSVPSDRVSELRLQMASSGTLAGGHVGFDIFDRTSFGVTDFTQQVNYQRAIEGELGRTLEGMDEVESARVHVTQPHDSIYADKVERAKASVMLRMRQGRMLTRERTEAVVSLVASAVEGLDPADVAVMDTQGRVLSQSGHGVSGGGGGDASTFNSHLEASRKFEGETAARIVSMLEPITGVGHARADVAAKLDFSQVEQTEEKYDPKSQVIRSQQTSQEVRNNALAATGNVVGVRANDPTAKPSPVATASPTTSGDPSGDRREAVTTSYEMNKTVTRTVGGGGQISRLSVSVLVDFKNVNGVSTTRTPDELRKMQELVSAAVGIDSNRGDQIVVESIPFDQPTVEVRTPTWMERNTEMMRTGIKYGALALVALLLIFFVIRPAKKALQNAAKSRELIDGGGRSPLALPAVAERTSGSAFDAPRTVAEIEADMEAQVAREIASFPQDAVRASALRKQLIERTRKQPESVAMTVRGWLQEGSR
ncbi:MAG TPA: flagellar basal-body MS-ring/collar protein FliF [Pyrinomonadaceae bacterium]|nr:flagellar basal-body MS-ring/collar protein FliF [Pyrinomonadaceae bacterium]